MSPAVKLPDATTVGLPEVQPTSLTARAVEFSTHRVPLPAAVPSAFCESTSRLLAWSTLITNERGASFAPLMSALASTVWLRNSAWFAVVNAGELTPAEPHETFGLPGPQLQVVYT